ncbi:MAG: hypothetical protein J6Y37_15195 [Paludibacteraceae bacterium]|nr:hypothetical protein [Paludibacteraceae bacterium]
MKRVITIYGFPKSSYSKGWLDSLTKVELSETALSDGDVLIYDGLQTFLTDLNDGVVGVSSNWFYFVEEVS